MAIARTRPILTTATVAAVLALGAGAVVAGSWTGLVGPGAGEGRTVVEPINAEPRARVGERRADERDVKVEAPHTRVETSKGEVRVEAPFTSVERSDRGVRVRAPFVDIHVPR